MQLFFISLLGIFICDVSISSSETRSSSKCSVVPCSQSTLSNCISYQENCFNFQTINGTNVCAPASSCDLLDPCDQNGDCLSKTTVCIINSCCAQPVCLPILLTELCRSNSLTKKQNTYYTTISTETTQSIYEFEIGSSTEDHEQIQVKTIKQKEMSKDIIHPKICSNASWNHISTIVASFPDLNPQDFSINQHDIIYIPDLKYHTIRKYSFENSTQWSSPMESVYLPHPTAIFVDIHDNIYIWDSEAYQIDFWSSVHRNHRTLLSFHQCKQSVQFDQICFPQSIFVDNNQTIYISESSKNYLHANRVMKFEYNTTIGRVIAGTLQSGSSLRQLNLPQRIFMDDNGILYVADIGNARIQQFYPGKREGKTIVFIEGITDFMMDSNGDIYVLIKSDNTVKRFSKASMYRTKEDILKSPRRSIRLQFGIDGSIYILNEEKKTIEKFEIFNNHC